MPTDLNSFAQSNPANIAKAEAMNRYNADLEQKLKETRNLVEQLRAGFDSVLERHEERGDDNSLSKGAMETGLQRELYEMGEQDTLSGRRLIHHAKPKLITLAKERSLTGSLDESLIHEEVVIANPHVSVHDHVQYLRTNGRPVVNPKATKYFQVDKETLRKKYQKRVQEFDDEGYDDDDDDEEEETCSFDDSELENVEATSNSKHAGRNGTRLKTATLNTFIACCFPEESGF